MKYYVYELISSVDNKPFYIGKGTGRRMYMHEYYAKKDSLSHYQNRKLLNKIRSIWSVGGSIIHNPIFFTDDNMKAFEKETDRILEIGLENLCNLWITPPTSEEIYKLRAKRMRGLKLSKETKQKIQNTLQGHSVSEATRRKISLSQIGKKRPCSETRRIAIAKAKSPTQGFPPVISPESKIYYITVLSDFCKEHNLHLPGMCGLLKRYKNAKSHRGWRLADIQQQ